MSQIIQFDTTTALADIETITGDSGGAVGPNGAGNISLVTGDLLTITGNPGTNTLTLTMDNDFVATAVTNDATPTTLFSIAVPMNSSLIIRAFVSAAIDDYSGAYFGTLSGGFYRAAGGAIRIPTVFVSEKADPIAFNPAGINAVLSGNTALVQVIGTAGDTINWRGRIIIESVTV